jgi:hypothetical protein
MIVSISQPTLFSWIGYYNIIKNSDIFVFFDNVKFEKRSWQMRNKIKSVTKNEEKEIWVRIPTKIANSNIQIKDVEIDNSQDWKNKHIKAFETCYGKKMEEIIFLKEMYKKEWTKLSDFNIYFIEKCCDYLGIKTKLIKASELNAVGKKSNLLLDICTKLKATDYFTSVGAKEYLEKDKEMFQKSGINIIYHNYIHPTYQQLGKKFLYQLSILDLIFNEGKNAKKFV